jgi:hypothetical protein
VCWKDKREVYLLTNMHNPPASGRFVDEEGNASKPLCTGSYNKSMGFMDLSDMMVNSYCISRKTWKLPRKLFYHLLDPTILNIFISVV